MNQKKLFTILFGLGILLALTAAFLMFLGILPIPARIVILIVGISLIATSAPIAKTKNLND